MRLSAWVFFFIVIISAGLLASIAWTWPDQTEVSWWILLGAAMITTLLRLNRVRTPNHQAYEGSTIGLFAAIFLLPPSQFVLLVILAHVIEWIHAKTNTTSDHLRAWYIQPFNIAKTVLSAAPVYILLERFPIAGPDTFGPIDLAILLLVNGSYVVTNQLLLGIVLFLARGITFTNAGILRDGLVIELPLATVGFMAVQLLNCSPWLIFLVFAPILLIYQAFMLPTLQQEAIQSLEQFNDELQSANQAIQQANDELFLTLANVFDARDPYVAGHAAQVAAYAVAIAHELDLPPEQVEIMRRSGYLHDIGKIAIPESILHKPAKLTDEEYEQIKQHPTIGADLIATSQSLRHLAPIVRHHHERWDGHGYPDGLAGYEIPLESRILNVCDSVEAMASDRPYQRGLSQEQIVAEVRRCAGTQFDPTIADAFIQIAENKAHQFVVNSAHTVTTKQAEEPRTFQPIHLKRLKEIYEVTSA